MVSHFSIVASPFYSKTSVLTRNTEFFFMPFASGGYFKQLDEV